ncbi:MAG: hypothetical protein FJW40_06730 [Acidobacteria bacterium]|nr:hypothetical protein [Acidobacteriota bacterium]
MPYYSTFNLLTTLLLGCTVWLIIARFTSRLDSNYPLAVYVAAFAHSQAFAGGLNTGYILFSLAAALFLRFEFIGGPVLTVVRALDLLGLGYIGWRSLTLIFLW